MLKNSKQNDEKAKKSKRKKELKMYSSNSITVLKNSSKKIKNKHNQKKSIEKKTIKKQSSCISNATIENDTKKKFEKKIGRHLSMRSSDIKRKKIIENKIDIEIYLKEIKTNKKNIKSKTKKINSNNNFSTEINSKNILNKNLNLFSPIEKIKNKKIYNISIKSNSKSKSKSKKNILTNNNINYNKENNKNKKKENKNNSNSIKSSKKRKLYKNESNINLNMQKEKLNIKPFCTMLNIPNNNKIKEINYLSEVNNNNEKKNKKIIKSIKIINNATNKYEELSQEDIIFNNIYKQKEKIKKKLSYNEPNYMNSTSSYKNKTKNNKKNNSIKKKKYINNNNNNQTRNNQLNKKIYNTNFNINTQTQTFQEKKSLTIVTNNNNNNEIKHKHKIKSERNKNTNIEFKTQNSNINKNSFLKIVSLFDKLKKYKNGKKIKKNNLELCSISNTNNIKINSTNNNNINNNNNFPDENQIKENLVNNALTMYSIYILSKYYQHCDKIGLTKIILFDKNKEQIPIIYYNTNNNLNTKQKIGIFSLFNNNKINKENISNNFSLYECNNKDIALILEFKNNLCINFFIKSINAENIDFIQINNYCDLKNNISSIKYIEIFKGNQLIYNGNLHQINIINKIYINNNKKAINNKIYNSVINTNKNLKIMNDIKQRPLSSSKPRSNIETQNTKTSTYRKSEVDEYYKKRNVFKKSYKKNFILIDNKENNNKYKLDYFKKQNDFLYKCLNKKYYMNDIRNTKLVTGNLKQEINISNTYTLNNMTNNVYDIQKTYYDFGELFTNNTNSEISNNIKNINNINKKLNSQRVFYISSQNNNINTTDESNMISKIKDNNIINAYDTNYKKENDEKIIIRSNSEKKYKNHLIKTQKSILFQKILEENNKDINYNNINNNHYSNNISIYENINKYSTYNNYIEFNKIRFVLTSNYGHKKFIGLTGIEFYDIKEKLINIETASSVGALPKDLKTIYNDNEEVRIFENVFNNYNNTNDIDNMWVTKFNKISPYTFIEIYFEEKIKISKIKFFNYNQKDKLDICVKTLDIYLDDKFYSKINLRQGLGDYAYDYLDNNNNNINNSFLFDNKIFYDFGQIIEFPLLTEEKNFSEINTDKYDQINFASLLYEQSYETPYLPCGEIIKFQFVSNYYKGICLKDEMDLLKYNDIGINKIEIFDKEGKNIELNYKNNNYKIISNCEMVHNKEKKIIINGIHNENNDNSVYFIFNKMIQISYIKFYPLTNDKKIKSLNSLKYIKIFINNNIIFEGNLYLYYPTIILFTCDSNIIKNINEKYLTKNIKFREYKEIFKENYISLIFH